MGGDPGSHDREDMWYFVAPSSFIGDKLEALDGSLTFSIGFDAFNDNGKPLIRGWDVILESTLRRLKVISSLPALCDFDVTFTAGAIRCG